MDDQNKDALQEGEEATVAPEGAAPADESPDEAPAAPAGGGEDVAA
ncbi:MAG TPA: hypothetical protein VJA87_03465 [Candidatus Paceibacterota bacterium]